MYIMGLGNKPVGECYLEPPSYSDTNGHSSIAGAVGGGSAGITGEKPSMWLMGQYYDGTKIKLINFKEPQGEPDEDSIEGRVRALEIWQYYMTKYAEYFNEKFCDATGVEFKTLQEFIDEFEDLTEEKPDPPYNKEDNDSSDETDEEEITEYAVSNVDMYRGKKEEGGE
jgi:hypothetical protein